MTKKLRHLVFGPDGNRRYADKQGISFLDAYELLSEKLVEIVKWSFEGNSIDELSLWLMQEYNWKREPEEIPGLSQLIIDSVGYLCSSDIAKRMDLQVKVVGELDTFYEVRPTGKKELEERLQIVQGNQGKRINVLAGYNHDKELQRALERCKSDGVEFTFAGLSARWVIPPVDLFLRTGQPDGFVRLSSYWPGIERGRVVSTPTYPQELTKEEFGKIINNYLNLKDSVKLVRAAQVKIAERT